jgi:sugar lactone lactonase YvrE
VPVVRTGELVKVTTSGEISRVIDISASQGHIVPTAITKNNGNFFVGNLNVFPIVEGSSNIYKITPDGQIQIFASGFTTVLGVAFDEQKRLYVLENTTGAESPTPGTGKIVRITPPNTREDIASGLSLPTAMTFGPDGKLYVSNWGFGVGSGEGQVLQITVPN